MEKNMDNNMKFTVIVDKLNRLITELNIKISKNPEDINLKNKLEELIEDKNILYKGNIKDLENIVAKYGDKINE